METAVQVTIYLNESDKWDRILRMLQAEGIRGASVFHAVAGFNGRHDIHRSSLVDSGGNLPVTVVFVDVEEHVRRVLPKVAELAPRQLIVRENVVIEQGSFE
jgi:PII-like signaling protein